VEVGPILKRAAEKGGFSRIRYIDKDIPDSISDITVVTCFGDLRSIFIASSILLKRYREEMKGSKYLILVSWPGFECLFPYVSEYWTIREEGLCSKFYSGASGLGNGSKFTTTYQRHLNHFFEDVIDISSIMENYYTNGITQLFWDRFKHVKVTLPSVPSSAILGDKINKELGKRQGYKIFYYPAIYIQTWRQGCSQLLKSPKEFWSNFAKRLCKEGFVPVICKNVFTYDISNEVGDEAIYFTEHNFYKVLGAMRALDCTLDVFSGISRLAIAARSPFVACDERSRYVSTKEYEIDGLCCPDELPREYLYKFAVKVESGDLGLWESGLYVNIIRKLNCLLPDLDRNKLPPASEGTHVVPYEKVRQQKVRRYGTRFIKIEHN
jgi:hypothetical protein